MSLAPLVRRLRRALDADSLPDADLLARFRRRRDPAAFEALVHRHGPRVLATCRRVLADPADADDAAQAAFLVLMRNPRAVRSDSALGAWLSGVAHRVSLKAAARRKRREQVEARAEPRPPAAAPDLSWAEACAILHEELDRLPDRHRLPLILCYLEGLSRDEAAARLGRSLNQVKRGLEVGRASLRKRLARRGVTLSAGLLAAVARSVEGRLTADVVFSMSDAIKPSVADLARAVPAGSGLRWVAAAAASALVATAAIGLAGGQKPAPPGKEMPAAPAAKKDAPADAPAGGRITFAGRVVNSDGKPVPGAKVFLLGPDTFYPEYRPAPGPRATTDQDGRFRFDEPAPIKPDMWRMVHPQVVAVADGFGLGVLPADSKGLADAEVRLPIDLPITGRVLNLEGKPVAGARVRVVELMAAATDDLSDWFKKVQADGWDEITRVMSPDLPRRLSARRSALPGLPPVTTDKDGRFTVAGVGRERVTTVEIAGDGIATARLTVLTQAGKSGTFPPDRRRPPGRTGEPYYRLPFEYVTSPDQPFEGRVTDKETGTPIPGVTVRQWWSETTTDKDGRYRLTGLRPGPTSLDFAPGPNLPYHVRMAPGGARNNIQTARVDVQLLRAPWVAGTLIDVRTRKPVAGARVFYKSDKSNRRAADYFDKGRGVDVEARTAPDGSFRLAGAPGKGWLFVYRDEPGVSAAERPVQGDTDRTEPPVEVETSDQSGAGMAPRMYQALVAVDIDPKAPKTYTVTIDPGLTVPVILTDPDGKPVAGAIALGVRSPWFNWSKPLASEKVEVPAVNPDRPRALFFYHPDRNLGVLFQPKKGDAGPWTVKLPPTATVTGTLVLPDGKPYPNADLALSFTYPGERGPTWLPDHSAHARFKTDANGKFTFTKLIGDVDYVFWYWVLGDKFGTSTTIPFRARPGETKDLGTVKTDPPRE